MSCICARIINNNSRRGLTIFWNNVRMVLVYFLSFLELFWGVAFFLCKKLVSCFVSTLHLKLFRKIYTRHVPKRRMCDSLLHLPLGELCPLPFAHARALLDACAPARYLWSARTVINTKFDSIFSVYSLSQWREDTCCVTSSLISVRARSSSWCW